MYFTSIVSKNGRPHVIVLNNGLQIYRPIRLIKILFNSQSETHYIDFLNLYFC